MKNDVNQHEICASCSTIRHGSAVQKKKARAKKKKGACWNCGENDHCGSLAPEPLGDVRRRTGASRLQSLHS